MRKKALIIKIISAILIIYGVFMLASGFSKKNNYTNSEYSESVNAYVGGDAYNYIINASYFTGYSVIGSSSILGAIILYGSLLVLESKESCGIKGDFSGEDTSEESLPQIR